MFKFLRMLSAEETNVKLVNDEMKSDVNENEHQQDLNGVDDFGHDLSQFDGFTYKSAPNYRLFQKAS